MDFTIQAILILILVGLAAGTLSGFVGIGGGMVIVPAMVYLLGYTQLQGQGTSLAVLMMPVGVLAVINYYKAGNINFTAALIIGSTFIVGAYFGSKMALKLPDFKVKFIFALLMLFITIKMLIESGTKWFGHQ